MMWFLLNNILRNLFATNFPEAAWLIICPHVPSLPQAQVWLSFINSPGESSIQQQKSSIRVDSLYLEGATIFRNIILFSFIHFSFRIWPKNLSLTEKVIFENLD